MRLPEALRLADYRRLFTAGIISELGSFVTDTALMLYLFKISGQDSSLLGLSKAVFLVSFTMGGIFGGPLGDKMDRRRIMMACEWARLPFVASLLFFQAPWWIIVVNATVGLFTGAFNPARQALVNSLVPKEMIAGANALFGSSMAILHMLGPLLGGAAVSFFGGIREVVAMDILTYVAGLYLLSRISAPTAPAPKEMAQGQVKARYFDDLREGIALVLGRKDLRQLLMAVLACGLAIGILIPLMPAFIQKKQGLGELAYGISLALFGAGGLMGGPVASALMRQHSPARLAAVGISLEPLMMLIWLNFPIPQAGPLIFLVWGVIVFARFSAIMTHYSRTVELGFMARVHSLTDLAFVVPSILGGMIVGVLGNKIDSYTILMTTAWAFTAGIAAMGALGGLKPLWQAESRPVEGAS